MATSTSTAWMHWGCCSTRPDLPWITDAADVSPWDALTMQEMCASCPVRLACLAHAQAIPETGGWWAGTDRDPNAASIPAPSWATTGNGDAQGVLPLSVLGGAAA